jgi:uncharacterized cupredoxin-like copper-binding protein
MKVRANRFKTLHKFTLKLALLYDRARATSAIINDHDDFALEGRRGANECNDNKEHRFAAVQVTPSKYSSYVVTTRGMMDFYFNLI